MGPRTLSRRGVSCGSASGAEVGCFGVRDEGISVPIVLARAIVLTGEWRSAAVARPNRSLTQRMRRSKIFAAAEERTARYPQEFQPGWPKSAQAMAGIRQRPDQGAARGMPQDAGDRKPPPNGRPWSEPAVPAPSRSPAGRTFTKAASQRRRSIGRMRNGLLVNPATLGVARPPSGVPQAAVACLGLRSWTGEVDDLGQAGRVGPGGRVGRGSRRRRRSRRRPGRSR